MKNHRIYRTKIIKDIRIVSKLMFSLCNKAKVVKCAKIITAHHNNIRFLQLRAQLVFLKVFQLNNKFNRKIIITVKVNRTLKNSKYSNKNKIIM